MTDCPHAWPAGLASGLLIECRFAAKHRGWHRIANGSLSWGGKLTPPEVAVADALRSEARQLP
jgi:hypothetical protein